MASHSKVTMSDVRTLWHYSISDVLKEYIASCKMGITSLYVGYEMTQKKRCLVIFVTTIVGGGGHHENMTQLQLFMCFCPPKCCHSAPYMTGPPLLPWNTENGVYQDCFSVTRSAVSCMKMIHVLHWFQTGVKEVRTSFFLNTR